MTKTIEILVESDLHRASASRSRVTRCFPLPRGGHRSVRHDQYGPARLAEAARSADVIISNHKFDIGRVKETAPSFAWLQVTSAGVEAYLKTLPDDVILTNASGVHAEKGRSLSLSRC